MSRRIEIELTSSRDDATFTWRAAGAREPKGDVAVAVLPDGAAVGDRFRVEIDTGLDGHEILGVVPDRAPRKGPERLELLTPEIPDDKLVTSRLASRPKGRRKGDRRERRDGDNRGRGRGRAERRDRPERRDGGDDRRRDAKRPEGDQRSERKRTPRKRAPRAPRLRPGRAHRAAYIATLPAEQQPIADKLSRGGMPNLRQAIDRDNAQRREQGQPEVPVDGLVRMAEGILPRLQIAEWHDRADAALAAIDEVDLRDLRSVVVAADDHAKSDETRALAAELRDKLTERVDRAQAQWLAELETAVKEGRIARVLNLSSRPPKAGSPLPPPLADRMVEVTNAALSAESPSGRWVALLDALAYSPIRSRVEPTSIPAEPSDELRTKVAKLKRHLPQIAARFAPAASPAPATPVAPDPTAPAPAAAAQDAPPATPPPDTAG